MILPDYVLVNDDGHIYNKETGKQLNETVHTTSHLLCVSIKIDGKWVQKYVHRLIAEKYVPNPEPGIKTHVIHKDGDPYNNVPGNLMWMSNSEFMSYKHSCAVYKSSVDKLIKLKSKPVIATDPVTGEEFNFDSITNAAIWVSIRATLDSNGETNPNENSLRESISRALKRTKNKLAFGLEWRYA